MNEWDLNRFSNSVDTEYDLKNVFIKYFSRNKYFIVLSSTFLPSEKVFIRIAIRKPLKISKKVKIENELKNLGYRVLIGDGGIYEPYGYECAPKRMHIIEICAKKEKSDGNT